MATIQLKPITWNDRFSVGSTTIDAQHQELLKLGNEIVVLLDETKQGIDRYDDIARVLGKLIDYTEYHFEEEEKLFENPDYLDEMTHKFQHKLFVKKLKSVDLDHVDEDPVDFLSKLMQEVFAWITEHILGMDQTYKTYLA